MAAICLRVPVDSRMNEFVVSPSKTKRNVLCIAENKTAQNAKDCVQGIELECLNKR